MPTASIYDGRRFFTINDAPTIRRFVSFDTEDNSRGKTLYTVFHDGVKPVGFTSVERAIEFFYQLSGRHRLHVAAHNLEYDLVNVFRDRLRLLELHYFGGRIMSAKLAGANLVFWDSLNHSYHAKLAQLGETVGIPKMSSDHGWTEGRRFTDMDKRYAGRDAEIVQKYMTQMQEVYRRIGAEMKTTCPATSMDYWRRHYLEGSIPAVSDPVRKWFRKGYYGGRVEIFRMHASGRIGYYDINSLYPFVMRKSYPDVAWLERDGRYGIVDATVEIPNMPIPPLPIRLDKLVFPIGRCRGQWCSCELNYARSIGVRVVKVHNRIGSRYLCQPFAAFVDKCYAERMNAASKLENTVWKFLMNSLYGKFGTDGNSEIVKSIEDCSEQQLRTAYLIGPLAVVRKRTIPAPYANILWAAWTTALARIELHKALMACIDAGLEPLYCDTDSIFFLGNGKPPFETGPALGQWKREAKVTRFDAKAPKVYQYQTSDGMKIRCKGVPVEAQQAFFDGLKAVYRKPLRLREANKSGKRANVWECMEKLLRSKYDKRTILKGGRTEPIALPSR